MVDHVDRRPTTCIVHVDVILTRSKVKVKVTGLMKFQKLHFSTSISSAILAWTSKLMVDYDSTGPSLERVRARFLNFFLTKLSRDFKLRGMSILRELQRALYPYCLRTATWSGTLVVLYVLCMLI